jgi:hypothetical protein
MNICTSPEEYFCPDPLNSARFEAWNLLLVGGRNNVTAIIEDLTGMTNASPLGTVASTLRADWLSWGREFCR